MEILQFLSCSFITSQTTASFSTAALQDPYSAYQVQCFTAAYKLIFHPNSNSNWSHLQPLAQASCQKQQKLGKSTANSLRPIILTVIHSLSKYGSQQHAMPSLVILPRSSLAAVRCSAYARIKAANFCESSPIPHGSSEGCKYFPGLRWGQQRPGPLMLQEQHPWLPFP